MAISFAVGFVEDAFIESTILEVFLVLSDPLERVDFVRLRVRLHHFMPAMRAEPLIRSLIVAEIAYADIDADSFRPLPTEEGPFARGDRLHTLLAVVHFALNFDSRHLLLFLLTGTLIHRVHFTIRIIPAVLEVIA